MIEYSLPLKRTVYPNDVFLGSYKSGRFFINQILLDQTEHRKLLLREQHPEF